MFVGVGGLVEEEDFSGSGDEGAAEIAGQFSADGVGVLGSVGVDADFDQVGTVEFGGDALTILVVGPVPTNLHDGFEAVATSAERFAELGG